MSEQFTVELDDDDIEALKQLATRRGMSVNDVLKRAIAQSKYFEDAEESGSKVLLQEPDKSFRKVNLP